MNGALSAPGFGEGATDILFTPAATMLGVVCNLLPYTVFCIYLSMAWSDRDLMLAAYDAGVSRFRTFWEMTLALARPGILAGAILVLVLALGVFFEPKGVGGGTWPMTAELIRQTFEARLNWPLGAASTLLVIMIGTATLAIAAARILRATKAHEEPAEW